MPRFSATNPFLTIGILTYHALLNSSNAGPPRVHVDSWCRAGCGLLAVVFWNRYCGLELADCIPG
jgi:hypothetical protein